jgi:uncharacterized protein YwgA
VTLTRYGEFAQEFEIIVGRPMETGTLEDRIIIQKIAYLLYRMIGADFSYKDFSWYLHGIFSWDLWYDVIHLWNPTQESLQPEKIEMLDTIKEKFNDSGLNFYFKTANNLELITTTLYCAKEKTDLNDTNSDLIAKVMRLKSKFKEEEVINAIEAIKNIDWNFS